MKFDKELSEEDIKKLQYMASLGMSQESMAVLLSISETTLERMIKHRDAVREAIKKGRAGVELEFTQIAAQKAKSFENFYFSMWWAKVKLGWRDTTHLSLTVNGGGEKAIEEMTAEEREARIQKLLDVRTKLLAVGDQVIDVEAVTDDAEQEEEIK